MVKHLYTVPILPCTGHPGGSIVITEPRPAIYLLTFTSPPDNRLTTNFCRAFISALDLVEFGGHAPGVVISTSGIPKFYSNGLDLDIAFADEGFWVLFYSVWIRLLTFPMPTIALLNGHTFAGALMLAMAHDYRLAPAPKGFLCLNELLFGAGLKPPMAALFRHKLPNPATYRLVALEAHRFTGEDAVRHGLCDALAPRGLDDALDFLDARGLPEKPKKGSYGLIKSEMYKDLILMLKKEGVDAEDARYEDDRRWDAEKEEFGKVFVEQFKKDAQAKL